jgi:hypothetical protein
MQLYHLLVAPSGKMQESHHAWTFAAVAVRWLSAEFIAHTAARSSQNDKHSIQSAYTCNFAKLSTVFNVYQISHTSSHHTHGNLCAALVQCSALLRRTTLSQTLSRHAAFQIPRHSRT